jgi:hypothetical protein
MNARLDCQLPHHLATLGAVLLMTNDALGWWTLIEGVSPHFIPRSFPSWTWRICRAGFVGARFMLGRDDLAKSGDDGDQDHEQPHSFG